MNEYVAMTLDVLNSFDWVLITVIGVSTLYGLFRGFIKEALTVKSWALAAWLSYFYSESLSVYFEPHVENPFMRIALMVLAVFIVILTFSTILRSGLRYLVDKAGLAGLDYVLGAIFGLFRGVVLSMLLMVFLMNFGFSHDPWWKESQVVKRLSYIMEKISDHLPENTQDIYIRYVLPKDKKD
jgi:membrane protein required for colicin V production